MPIIPTLTGGPYETASVSGADPDWTPITAGLTSTNVLFFATSLVNTEYLLLTSDTAEIFQYSGSSWSSILTNAAARTLTGDSETVLQNVCYDLSVINTIYAFAGPESGLKEEKNVYILKSINNGGSWSLIATKFLDYIRAVGGLFARNETVVAAVRGGGLNSGRLFYSTDSGDNFKDVSISGGVTPWCWVSPSGLALLRNGADLASYDGNAIAQLIASEAPVRADAMNLDTSAFVNNTGDLYESTDDWQTYTSATVDAEMQSIADLPSGLYLSGTEAPSPGNPTAHTWNGVTFQDFNGTAPDNIPPTDGGIAYGILGCTALSSAVISGDKSVDVGENITLTVTTSPSDATPGAVTWSPTPDSGQGTKTAVYSFSTAGCRTITATVANCSANVQATYSVCACAILKQTVYEILAADSAVAALVGVRIFPDQVPEKDTVPAAQRASDGNIYPCIVYHAPISQDNTDGRVRGSGAIPRVISAVQFDCYDRTSFAADLLAGKVTAAFGRYNNPCCVGYAFTTNRIADGWNVGIKAFREIVDITIEHKLVT